MTRLAAVVLAGGEGRRMGGNKPLRRLSGVRLIDIAVATALRSTPYVAIAVKDAAQTGEICGARLVFDPPGLEGPIAGLAAGFEFARSVGACQLLALPCDMPLLPADLVVRLTEALRAPGKVSIAACAQRIQPACALWEVATSDALAAYCAEGRSSLRGFADRVGAAIADWPEDSRDAFSNTNTPSDLAALGAGRMNLGAYAV